MSGRGVYGMFGAAAAHLNSDAAAQQQQAQLEAEAQQRQAGCSGAAAFSLEEDERQLDLVFIMDATGSMGSYIASATRNIETICENIIRSEQLSSPGALRIALVAYRDHPPQDHTYIVKTFGGFTTSVETIKQSLSTLYASGGGDGPEAVTAALKAACDLEWRQSATRLAVLIADAPPHGIGEYGDGFHLGSPDGEDPLRLARGMAAAGIPLFMVACEPALSGYQQAADFYQGLVRLTGGQLLPLTTASLLTPVIIGAAAECMSLDRLHREVGDQVAQRIADMSLENNERDVMDSVTRDLFESLTLRRETTKHLIVESIYNESAESKHNIEVWTQARDLAAARPLLKKVVGSRLSAKYLRERSISSSYKPFTPYAHPRFSPPTASGSSSTAERRRSSGGASGSRKVVSDFSAFSASPGMSFGGGGSAEASANASPVLGSGAFGSPQSSSAAFQAPRDATAYRNASPHGARGRRADAMDDDDDDEEEGQEEAREASSLPVAYSDDGAAMQVAGDDGSTLALKSGAISMEQVRRLAMVSAQRGGLGAA